MSEFPVATSPAPGVTAVDRENRIDFERPIISRLNSLQTPVEIREGIVFALERYAPAADGRSAARIEEEIMVTADGCKVITLFPCEKLMVANAC